MGIGTGIFLIAVGAILTFAVNATVSGLSLDAVGVILMIAGVMALVAALIAARRTEEHVVHERGHHDV